MCGSPEGIATFFEPKPSSNSSHRLYSTVAPSTSGGAFCVMGRSDLSSVGPFLQHLLAGGLSNESISCIKKMKKLPQKLKPCLPR